VWREATASSAPGDPADVRPMSRNETFEVKKKRTRVAAEKASLKEERERFCAWPSPLYYHNPRGMERRGGRAEAFISRRSPPAEGLLPRACRLTGSTPWARMYVHISDKIRRI